jgi:hypothetical protein
MTATAANIRQSHFEMTRTVKVVVHVSSARLLESRIRCGEVTRASEKTDVFCEGVERWMFAVVYPAWKEVEGGREANDCQMSGHLVVFDREWVVIVSNAGRSRFQLEVDVAEALPSNYDAIPALFCAVLRHLRGARGT